VLNRTDQPFTPDDVRPYVDYFDKEAKAFFTLLSSDSIHNDQLLAHYLLGRAYHEKGDAPMALESYQHAIDHADTTSASCDYYTLMATYGQMSILFHQQNLPQDEIWALQYYIKYIQHIGDSLDYIISKGQLLRPYYLLNEKDSVLSIINDTYRQLKQLGHTKEAAGSVGPAIYIYTERNEFEKAKQAIDIFEHESGLFDKGGNIVKGREEYYNTKGFYELATNNIDSAEYYFKKAIRSGFPSDAYKGLLSVYRKKRNIDSLIKYSFQNEAALDSIHNQMQTDVIHQMSSLYNYNKSEKRANQEAEKARTARFILGITVFSSIIVFLVILYFYRQYKKRKKEEIRQLEVSLHNAEIEQNKVQSELRKLKAKDYEGLIAEKEKKEKELTHIIENLRLGNGFLDKTDNLESFSNSKIAHVFANKTTGKSEKPIPTPAEWRLLVSQFNKDMPALFEFISNNRKLSPLELHTCILLLLGYPESVIVNMSETSSAALSTAKSRANLKLFGKKDAHSLKINLLRAIKHA